MIIIFVLFSIISAIFFYRRTLPELPFIKKFFLTVLRAVSISIVLVYLFNPILYFVKKISFKEKIVFLNDNSESMKFNFENNPKLKSLFDNSLVDLQKKYEKNSYHQQTYSFANGLNGNKHSSLLTKSISDLSEKKKLDKVSKIFLLSDGWLKDEDFSLLEDINIPINPIIFPVKKNDTDLTIDNVITNKTAYRKENVPILANVSATQFQGNASAILKVNGKKISSKKVDFSKESFQQIVFSHSFQKNGINKINVEIKADSLKELITSNNNFPSAIQILDNRSDVVILSDKLGWDIRFFNKAISNNDRLETKIYLSKNRVFTAGKIRFELEEILNENVISLIILNYGSLKLSGEQVKLIENFVAHGKGLIFQGKILPEISHVLPVNATKLNRKFLDPLQFTKKSEKYQTFSKIPASIKSDIPPVDYYYVSAKISAEILATIQNDDQSPAIVLGEYEKGKVLFFSFENLWKWQMREKTGAYSKFVSDLISWLSNDNARQFHAYPEKNNFLQGEIVTIKLQAYDEKLQPLRDLNAKISIKNEKDKIVFEDFLLRKDDFFQASIENLKAGKFTFKIIDEKSSQNTEGEFIISKTSSEQFDRGFNTPTLAYIAKITNGKMIQIDDLNKLEITPSIPKIHNKKYEVALYRKWLIIAIFLLSFCTELFFRKRWGLL